MQIASHGEQNRLGRNVGTQGNEWPPRMDSYLGRFSFAGLENNCDHMVRGSCGADGRGDVTNTEWLKRLLITTESESALYYEEARSIWRANFCSQTRPKPGPSGA